MPSILLSSITSITTYFLNIILSAFSSTAIAVYGVYFKLNSFIFMPVFGLNNGMVPIIAYNYGARNRKRITATIRNGLLLAMVVMLFGLVLLNCSLHSFWGCSMHPRDARDRCSCNPHHRMQLSRRSARYHLFFGISSIRQRSLQHDCDLCTPNRRTPSGGIFAFAVRRYQCHLVVVPYCQSCFHHRVHLFMHRIYKEKIEPLPV